MCRLPSIYEHPELDPPHITSASSPERIHNFPPEIERESGTHSGLGAFTGSPSGMTSDSMSASAPNMMDLTSGGGDSSNPSLAYSSQDQSEFSLIHASSPQVVFSPPSHAVSSDSVSKPNEGQDQVSIAAVQSHQTRQTPAASFSALFPAPQHVSSVTTAHTTQPYHSQFQRPVPGHSRSEPNPRHQQSVRYRPYSRSSTDAGQSQSVSQASTPNSSGSPAPPSLSSSLSSASLSGSRPSSRAVSATGFGSPLPDAKPTLYSHSYVPISRGGQHTTQPISQPSDLRVHRSSSTGTLNIPSYSSAVHRPDSAPTFVHNPPSQHDGSVGGSPNPHSQYSSATQEEEFDSELKLIDSHSYSNSNFSTGVRRSDFYGNPLPTLAGESAPTPTLYNRLAESSASGVSSGIGGSAPYYPQQQHSNTLDNRRLDASRGHHSLSHLLSGNPTLNTMSSNFYHADMDMDQMESYDEDELLGALPEGGSVYGPMGTYNGIVPGQSLKGKDGRQVRRRSSKACDQCRKSKCKCERTADDDACRNCLQLGTTCTFLGPSRKRGPPKGYIDAIESRLHQTEALIGILLSLANPDKGPLDEGDPKPDERAQTLLQDLRDNDPLAREIVERVDRGAYGTKGRKSASGQVKSGTPKTKRSPSKTSGDENSSSSSGTVKDGGGQVPGPPASVQGRGRMVGLGQEMEMTSFANAHPSNEWQDAMVERMKASMRRRPGSAPSEGPVQRRRRLSGGSPVRQAAELASTKRSPRAGSPSSRIDGSVVDASSYGTSDGMEVENVEGEEKIADGVGQLSINEEAQVRFHGKASGLHLLGQKQRVDGRNKGGIWHFPKARVWPPVAPTSALYIEREAEAAARERHARRRLPPRDVQEHLLELYFAHVHPFLPVIHKETFEKEFKEMHDAREKQRDKQSGVSEDAASQSAGMDPSVSASAAKANGITEDEIRRPSVPEIPTILLLSMFAIAARYAPVAHGTSASPSEGTAEADSSSGGAGGGEQQHPVPSTVPEDSEKLSVSSPSAMETDLDSALPQPQSGHMWTAGDGYLERAKDLLDTAYSNSRPSTCQALLLMAYREIGIGAMQQSWLYTGIAVRMAQDLGMHRSSEGWSCGEEPIFTPVQQQIRKRIWYACVIMDKYVSSYIGRPLSIFEADYDTRLPSDEELEELELWEPHPSLPNSILGDDVDCTTYPVPHYPPTPGRVLSCFNESARLSSVLARIVQAIYAVTPPSNRQVEAAHLEKVLDVWYMELPSYLQYNPNHRPSSIPPPNVLTLHMQYWCAVILLHRPFIPHYFALRRKAAQTPGSPVNETYSSAQKHFNLCVAAANHVTAIVTVYQERFCLKRCPVFLSYYIFTAGIMHMTTMAALPKDPQAPIGLNKCMEVLQRIEIVWPSAGRARELLSGARDDLPDYELPTPSPEHRANKRSVDDSSLTTTAISDLRTSSMSSQPYDPVGHGRYSEIPGAPGGPQPVPLYNQYNRPTSSDSVLGLPSGLSTSVLPQQYSTGFVDERAILNSQRAPTNVDDSHGRYAPYWSDYSMGQPSSMLGSMYDMSMMPSGRHGGHGSQNNQGYQSTGPMYMGNQYNMYPGSHLTPP